MLLLLVVIIHCKVFEIARVTLMRLCFWGRLISGQCFYTLALWHFSNIIRPAFQRASSSTAAAELAEKTFFWRSLCANVCVASVNETTITEIEFCTAQML